MPERALKSVSRLSVGQKQWRDWWSVACKVLVSFKMLGRRTVFFFDHYSRMGERDNREFFYPSLNAAYPQHRNMGNRAINVMAEDLAQIYVDFRNYARSDHDAKFPWAGYHHVMRQVSPMFFEQWSEVCRTMQDAEEI